VPFNDRGAFAKFRWGGPNKIGNWLIWKYKTWRKMLF